MKIPNFLNKQFVDKNGDLTSDWREALTQLFTQLQLNASDEGIFMPQQTPVNITSLNTSKSIGAILFNSTANLFEGCVSDGLGGGIFKPFSMTGSSASYSSLQLLNLTPNKALIADGTQTVISSVTTSTELSYVSGVTSGIQSQLNGKEPNIIPGLTTQYWRGDKTWQVLDTSVVPENINLYYTDARARASFSETVTGLDYSAVSGILSLTTGYVIPTTTEESNWNDAYSKRVDTWTSPLQFLTNTASISQSGFATDGYLSSIDWNTFNNKQNALTNPITGTGTSGQFAEFTGTTTIQGVTENTAFNRSFETVATNIKPSGIVNVGALNTISRADHIHPFSVNSPLSYNSSSGLLTLNSRSIFITAETNGIFNNYRSRNIGAAGNFNFIFQVPNDFTTLVACYVQGFVSAGASGTNKNIDLDVQYCNGSNQLFNQFTASDTTSLYDLTGYTNRLFNLPVTTLLGSIVAGSIGGIKVTHNTLGGSIDYIGVVLIYV